MSSLLLPRAPDRPPAQEGWGAGATLSLAAHAGLIAALAWSVQWRSQAPTQTEAAELWAAVPEAAAPPAASPAPPPEPVQRTPAPAPAPEPPPPPPQIVVEKTPPPKPPVKAPPPPPAPAPVAKTPPAPKPPTAAEKSAEQAQKLQALRDENLRRLMGQVNGNGDNPAGTAARSAGPSATYAGRVIARVRPNIVFTTTLSSNPAAEVELQLALDGTITGRRLARSSGIKEWDDAVLKAIDKTGVLPRDTDGSVPSRMIISFTPQ